LTRLVEILRLAYSGELAAAYAYRGHWRSVSDPATRATIQRIEKEELHHRNLLRQMLAALDRKPSIVRDVRAFLVGHTLGALCHISGWFAPMYGAGKLESGNIKEYETAARFAAAAGHPEFVDCLLTMAEVEWDHEKFFRSCVLSHKWSGRVRIWPEPAPRDEIRRSFAEDVSAEDRPASFAGASARDV
jgi:rubrerythrin